MPIFILLSMFFSEKIHSQNPIGTGLHPVVGDLYHTGGRIGIGTDTPYKLLHLFSDTVTTLRLSSMCDRCDTTSWDFHSFEGTLDFCYLDPTKCVPVMKLTEYGQLYLGTDNPNYSAIMQIDNTNKGLLIPRMTTNQKNAISSPANGLLVYDTDLKAFSYYNISSGTWLNTAISSELSDYLMISDFNNSVAGGIMQSDTANWNTAYNYSQNFTESDPIFTAWDKDYNDLTNKPDLFDGNWENLSGTVPNISIFTNDAGYITEADINSLWQEDGNGNIYRENGFVGIGTESPSKTLDIKSLDNHVSGDPPKKSTIRLLNESRYSKGIPGPGPTPNPKIYKWDIENNNDTLDINYISYDPDNIGGNVTPETKFSLSGNGTLTASKFVGDGSGLTNLNLPEEIWQQNGNDIYYNDGNVGIGISNPDTKLQLNNGAVKISGSSSLGQGARFQIDTEGSTGHTFLIFSNDNGEQFAVYGDGLIRAKKIKVQSNWADFIFYNNYKLKSLNELEIYINKNKHLPDIPNEEEIKTEGLDLGNMLKLQMQKIEELTLYIIQLNKENEELSNRILKLENRQ